MHGAAVAIVLVVASIGEGVVASERAAVDGDVSICPDGSASRCGDVAAHGAAADVGRTVVDDGTAAGIAAAVGDGAASDSQCGITVVYDAAAVDCFAICDGDIVEGKIAVIACLL